MGIGTHNNEVKLFKEIDVAYFSNARPFVFFATDECMDLANKKRVYRDVHERSKGVCSMRNRATWVYRRLGCVLLCMLLGIPMVPEPNRVAHAQKEGVLLCGPSGQRLTVRSENKSAAPTALIAQPTSGAPPVAVVAPASGTSSAFDEKKNYTLTRISKIPSMQVLIGTPYEALILPKTIRVELSHKGKPTEYVLPVNWPANSSVYRGTDVGTYVITGVFDALPSNIDNKSIQPTLAIDVLGGNIVRVPDLNDQTVVQNTAQENIGLPRSVKATVRHGFGTAQKEGTFDVQLEWKSGDYDPKNVGTYNFIGSLVRLPAGVTNTNNYAVTISVSVVPDKTEIIQSIFRKIFGRDAKKQELDEYVRADMTEADIERYVSLVKLSQTLYGEVVPEVKDAFEGDDDLKKIEEQWSNGVKRKTWIETVINNHFQADNASQESLAKEQAKRTEWLSRALNMSADELLKRFEIRNAIWMGEIKEATEQQYAEWLKTGYDRTQLRIAIIGEEKASMVGPFRALYGRYPKNEELDAKLGESKDARAIFDQLYDSTEYQNKARHEVALRTVTINNIYMQWLGRNVTQIEVSDWAQWLNTDVAKAMKNTEIVPYIENTVREACGGNARIKAEYAEAGIAIDDSALRSSGKRRLNIGLIVREQWKDEGSDAWIDAFMKTSASYAQMKQAVIVGRNVRVLAVAAQLPVPGVAELIAIGLGGKDEDDVYKEVVGDRWPYVQAFRKKYGRMPDARDFAATLIASDVSIGGKPQVGDKPPELVRETAQYSGTVAWSETGEGDRFFDVPDATRVQTVLSQDKKTATVTVTYEKVADAAAVIDPTIVLEAPQVGKKPAMTISSKDVELVGAIQWSSANGSALTGAVEKDSIVQAQFVVKSKGARAFYGISIKDGAYFVIDKATVKTQLDSDRMQATVTAQFDTKKDDAQGTSTQDRAEEEQATATATPPTAPVQPTNDIQAVRNKTIRMLAPRIGQKLVTAMDSPDVELSGDITWKQGDRVLGRDAVYEKDASVTAQFVVKGKDGKTFHGIDLESAERIEQIQPNKTYVAKIRLQPKSGYTLLGAQKDHFTVTGAYETSYDPDTEVITALFTSSRIDPPKNIVASMKTHWDKVSLSWNAVPNATGYVVYRNDWKIAELAGTAVSYDDQTALAGMTYAYRLTAVFAGSESEQSAAVFGKRRAGPANVRNVRVEYRGYDKESRRRPCGGFAGFVGDFLGGCWGWWIMGHNYTIRWSYPYEADDIVKFVLYRQTVIDLNCKVGVDLLTVRNCFTNEWIVEQDNIAPDRRSVDVSFKGLGKDVAHRFMVKAVSKGGASFYFSVPMASVLSNMSAVPTEADISPTAAFLKFPTNPTGVDDSRPHGDIAMTGWLKADELNLYPGVMTTDKEWDDKYFKLHSIQFLESEGTQFPVKRPVDMRKVMFGK
jgi:hypothetical protein